MREWTHHRCRVDLRAVPVIAEEYGQALAKQWETRWKAFHSGDDSAEAAEEPAT